MLVAFGARLPEFFSSIFSRSHRSQSSVSMSCAGGLLFAEPLRRSVNAFLKPDRWGKAEALASTQARKALPGANDLDGSPRSLWPRSAAGYRTVDFHRPSRGISNRARD